EVALAGALAANLADPLKLSVEVLHQRRVGRQVGLELLRAGVGVGAQHVHVVASTRTICLSTATLSPTATVISATCPSTGAVSTSSIFIDSSTTSGSPAATVSPAAAWTIRTWPGMGARTSPSPAASPSPA